MSMDFPVEISLDELARESYHILLVERGSPFEKIEMAPIEGAGSGCPPFRKVSFRYRVLEELKNSGKGPLGPEIEVGAAHTSMDMDMHKKRYLEGIMKSDYRPEYRTKADFGSARLIIFLNSNLEFTAGGAYEAPECRAKVLEAITESRTTAVQAEKTDD